MVYRVDLDPEAPDGPGALRLVGFPTVIDEDSRTDRVIADAWDLTAALCHGEVNDDRIAAMRANVTRQEGGRADRDTLVWTRANRSARFFDHVVGRLADGRQPDPDVIGDGAYLMRSTAFYGNGKWGLHDFDGIPPDGVADVPYRAQMLAAWLLRELSLDLVEHCALARNPQAAQLDGEWRRYFGLGNATGLGLVPYLINHPRVLDAWVAARELPLAYVLSTDWLPGSEEVARVAALLTRAVRHFAERGNLATAPYPTGPEMAAELAPLAEFARSFSTGAASQNRGARWHGFALELHQRAAARSRDSLAVVESILIEVDPVLDEEIEALLRVDEDSVVDLSMTCRELSDVVAARYGWVDSFDWTRPDQVAMFWYMSSNSQEPRRGRRGVDRGVEVELALDVARRVARLRDTLDEVAGGPDLTLAEFLLDHPECRWAVERVQTCAPLPYGEVHTNPVAADFVPLELQRMQLAMYGMENFSPQSTDWMRVTLFAGSPRADDIARGVDDYWYFAPKPTEVVR